MVSLRRNARDWRLYAAVGVATVLIGGAAANPPSRDAAYTPASTPAQQAPAQNGQPNQPAPIQSAAERIARALEAKNTYDQSQKGQQDAHDAAEGAREAARWAKWMFIIAVVETAVTAIGVVLLYYTLKEAKRSAAESNRLNREAMIADQRPWLSLEFKLASGITFGDDGARFMLEFYIHNTGRTPALELNFDCVPLPSSFHTIDDPRRILLEAANGDRRCGPVLFPDDGNEVPVPVLVNKPHYGLFEPTKTTFLPTNYAVFVSYRSPFGKGIHNTCHVASLQIITPQMGNRTGLIDVNGDAIPENGAKMTTNWLSSIAD